MLVELRVTNLGVIEDQTIVLGPGMTALTGETGAGKTLLVDAISLLTGSTPDPALVGPGAAEARIEGRFAGPVRRPFAEPGTEDTGVAAGEDADTVLTRVIPASGRSRCYIDGRMVSSAVLGEVGRALVDIHGQHTHQSLLSGSAQRDALDRAAGIDTSEVRAWRRRVRELTESRAGLGGDPRERARQIDLLSYQLKEIDDAGLEDPEEDRVLVEEEELLADAAGLVETAGAAWEALAGEDGVVERLGSVVSAVSTRRALSELHRRLSGVQEELTDVASDARRLAESVEDDPGRLARIGERRRLLTELRRKYGGTLGEVIDYREQLRRQVDELASYEERAEEMEREIGVAAKELAAAAERLWAARRGAAPGLARLVEERLHDLAMPRARFQIDVGADPSDESVTWLLTANPGSPPLPIAKVASGGELSRAMLAARLVMGPAEDEGPRTLIFDEVDAGIGGETAVAVGRALAALAEDHQVLVVTHLAQVAAFASAQLSVAKEVTSDGTGERTVATAQPLEGERRVVELARMLSGRPDSASARLHAEELLSAAVTPGRPGGRPAPGPAAASGPSGSGDPSPNSGRRRR